MNTKVKTSISKIKIVKIFSKSKTLKFKTKATETSTTNIMRTSYKMRRKVDHSPQHSAIRSYKPNTLSMISLSVAFIFFLCAASTHAAPKLDTQLKLLINDDELLMQPENHAQAVNVVTPLNHATANDPIDHLKLYRSQLKRLSYETIHRILRDENEPNYRHDNARYYQKRSYKPVHEVVRRAAPMLQELTNTATTTAVTAEKPAQHTLTLNHVQLRRYDAEHDYHGDCSAIYELDLSNNRLQMLNLSAFTALRHVELANNALTTIPLHGRESAASTIQILNLNNNQITYAMNISSTTLHELHLSGNQITQLSHLNLSMLSALETLDLSCNHITELETAFFPQRMHNLKYLNLANNRIGTIYRETFYNLLSLNTLLLSHNNISDIDYETFLSLPNLQYLDLSYNQLHGEAIRALQGIPDLVRLSIAYNPEVGTAMQEFVASWSLKELDASGTGLCQIPAALAQSVRTLKLTDNWLKIINCGDLDSYPLLQYLDLSHSRIEDIEDDALGRLEILETLFLDHNQLHKVPLSLPTSLQHLFLQKNEIMDIHEQSFQGLNNLQTLDLSGNKLLYLPALPLPKLLTLNLRAAGLRGVSQAMVHTLPRLRDLLLDENPIKCSDLLSIAEWASPCRIVEQRASSISSNSNKSTTEVESLNIEGNSIMGDLGVEEEQAEHKQKEQQQSRSNRIGFGKKGIEQIIAMSGALSDKLGQQHAQLQSADDEGVSVVKEDASAEQLTFGTEAAAANNELKKKFVRMHNFFEKFKSNCGARKQMTDKRLAEAAPTLTPPACAIELESSKMDHKTSEEATSHLPKDDMRKQSEKSNSKTTKAPPVSMQQYIINAGDINSSETKSEDNVVVEVREKKEMRDMIVAEAKFLKFNQKNFTHEIAETTAGAKWGAITKLAQKATTKTKEKVATNAKTEAAKTAAINFENYRTEAASDYRANASKAQATTAIIEKAAETEKAIQQEAQTYQTTKSQITNKSTATPRTTATNLPTVVAKSSLQVAATVAETGTGQSTKVNLLGQDIIAKTAITTEAMINRYSQNVNDEEVANMRTTKKLATESDAMQADAPKSNVEGVEAKKINGGVKQKNQEFERKYDFEARMGTKITQNVDAPESMLAKEVKTQNMSDANERKTQMQQEYVFETTKATKITVADNIQTDAPKSMQVKSVSANDENSMKMRHLQQMRGKQLEEENNRTKYDFITKTTEKISTNVDAPKSMRQKVKNVNAMTSMRGRTSQDVKKVEEYEEKHDFDRKAERTADLQQIDASKSIAANDSLQLKQPQQQIEQKQYLKQNTTKTTMLNTNPVATSPLNQPKEIYANQQREPNGSTKYALDEGITTRTIATTRDGFVKSLEMDRSSNTTVISNLKTLAVPANFLQMSRAQIIARGADGFERTNAIPTAKTDMQIPATNNDVPTTTATSNAQTTTITNILTTRQLLHTTIPSLSLTAKIPSQVMNLTRNDSENDYDRYKVQQNLTTKPTRITQFWQQHNFKRANPYPNDDISGQRQLSEGSGRWEKSKDELEIENVTKLIMTKTTTSTHLPPPHKHEPLQLYVRDRHLIGTPLLQHRGENMLVEAATELLKQATAAKTTKNTQSVVNTATTTERPMRATTKDAVDKSAMSDKALATSQATEANPQPKGEGEQMSAMNTQTDNTINSNGKSNNINSPNTKHSEAEAINVETNVTPMQKRIGSDEADKQILAGIFVTRATTATKIENMTAKTTMDSINSEEHKATKRTDAVSTLNASIRRAHTKKHDEIAGIGNGRSKSTLIMRKMTIQTKHATHEPQQPITTHYTLNTPRENEAVLHERASFMQADAFLAGKHAMNENNIAHEWETEEADMSEHAEEAPRATPHHKHSTVNTPIIRRSHERLLATIHNARLDDAEEERTVVGQERNAHHSFSSVSNQQRASVHAQEREPHAQQGAAATHLQTQKLLDVRKMGTSAAHPGLVILISCSLFFVLLIGLMHVYRCDILPWRRPQQRRPHHQLQFNVGAGDDDAHSFLHYHNNGGGQQIEARQQQQQWLQQPPPRWHHGTRERAPYSSPLHNLHVRELQKTSAVELQATKRVTRSNFDIGAYAKNSTAAKVHHNSSTTSNGSAGVDCSSCNSSSSLSSTRSSSTAGIMDADDSAFYVEMVSECGGVASDMIHSDMLPMELLAVASASNRNLEEDASAVTVKETGSIRLGGNEASACSERNIKPRDNKGSSALLSAGRKCKKGAGGRALTSASSSSARKFDLW
ncbi:uncharacterized protein 2mit [Eurosta solidaginis]|uniref:uncharacterized protein 2mit n=1 Tax=Eurosta solidaginis TaxID=178769 RepID=UPI0035305FFB